MNAPAPGQEFRAVITCTQDPCVYCRAAAKTVVVLLPIEGPFATAEAAYGYGDTMARNVYGASVHRVEIEARPITAWVRVPRPAAAAPSGEACHITVAHDPHRWDVEDRIHLRRSCPGRK